MSQGWTDADLRARESLGPTSWPAAKPKGERKARGMNSTESAYALYLDLLKREGSVREWWYEAVKMRVGEHCYWLADFLVELPDGRLELRDTKGCKKLKNGKTKPYAEEDAIVKARAIADRYPLPVFFVWQEHDGSWSSRRM